MVTGVLMRGTHASGVEFVHQGVTKRAEAAREVILCGGVFNSPQLLMLSGIGPADISATLASGHWSTCRSDAIYRTI